MKKNKALKVEKNKNINKLIDAVCVQRPALQKYIAECVTAARKVVDAYMEHGSGIINQSTEETWWLPQKDEFYADGSFFGFYIYTQGKAKDGKRYLSFDEKRPACYDDSWETQTYNIPLELLENPDAFIKKMRSSFNEQAAAMKSNFALENGLLGEQIISLQKELKTQAKGSRCRKLLEQEIREKNSRKGYTSKVIAIMNRLLENDI